MKKLFILVGILMLFMASNILAQVAIPRESNRQEIAQTVGDSKISIVYHRPNAKGRMIYGCETTDVIQKGNQIGACMVPYGQVWRTGANKNTIVEFSTDVTINGQALSAGKYGFFAIPTKNEWTLIFNKVNNEWGAFTYKVDQDALRVKVTPMTLATPRETLMYEFESINMNSTSVMLSWGNQAVAFKVNVGDINARVVVQLRNAAANAKADDMRTLNQAAGFVLNSKLTANYDEALGWLNKSIAIKETFGNLSAKARLLGEMGKTKEAIEAGEKAVQVGKAATPVVNTADFEKTLNGWKTKK